MMGADGGSRGDKSAMCQPVAVRWLESAVEAEKGVARGGAATASEWETDERMRLEATTTVLGFCTQQSRGNKAKEFDVDKRA